jgi:hypothetical protein
MRKIKKKKELEIYESELKLRVELNTFSFVSVFSIKPDSEIWLFKFSDSFWDVSLKLKSSHISVLIFLFILFNLTTTTKNILNVFETIRNLIINNQQLNSLLVFFVVATILLENFKATQAIRSCEEFDYQRRISILCQIFVHKNQTDR